MKTFAGSCLLLSVAFAGRAQSWQPTSAPATLWAGLACSADASVIAASVQLSPTVFTSLDSGATWTSNYLAVASGYFIPNLVMSADGSHICAPNFYSPGGIVCSSDFGHTWVTHPTPVAFRSVAISGDGQKLAAAPLGRAAGIFTSTDFGATWTSNYTANTSWYFIASSADGSKLAAPISFAPFVMTSTDSGHTWISNSVVNASCLLIASSADGSHLITGGNPQIPRSIYTSTDSGATWNPTGLSNAAWNIAVSSADGSHVVVAVGASMQMSVDYGFTWSPDSSLFTNGVAAVVSSADGAVLIAATGSGSPTHGPVGSIYIKRSVQPPTLNISASSMIDLSWLVPSTNFILQQTTDFVAGPWVAITNTPTLNFANLQDQIAIPLSAIPTFFRLSAQ